MPNLIALVLLKESLCDEVVRACEEAGVPGLSILESYGLSHVQKGRATREDLPLLPSLRALMEGDEVSHRIIFSVLPDGFDLEDLISRIETITGDLDAPGSGFLFVVPVTRVRGLRSR
jgi:nitrogen regulatory protein PII